MSTSVLTEKRGPFQPQVGETSVGQGMLRQFMLIMAFVGTIIINAAANIVPINGMTTGDLSDKYPIYITPAGYVFSIWSVIYLGLLAYIVYQALPSQRNNPMLKAIAWPFAISSIFNMAWIVVWHYEFVPLSFAIMLGIIGSLIAIYLRLRPHFDAASAAERWTTHIPFSIYLGWITVATVVNATVMLYNFGWDGGGISAEVWTAILLGVATIIGVVVTQTRRDIAYGMVLVWASVGIAVKHPSVPFVSGAAIATAVIMALSVGLVYRSTYRKTT